MSLRRILATFVGVLAILASTLTASPTAAATRPPRVVVIVGPVGQLTDSYREYGRSAAREAARWTSDVVTVASPDATWPAVRKALQGASIVIYLGHGNGFPSPYRSEPYPRTQNGLGLNPVAGVDDVAHQYFGESFLAGKVRLAPGAIVILSHLCYGSGNPEPGGPEPTVDVAAQRADNYAAGWLAAGARAVIAEAFGAAGDYVRDAFATGDPVGRIWRRARTYHGNVITTPSTRTQGATVLLDPTRPARGFYRSLVSISSSGSGEPIRPATRGQIAEPTVGPVIPSLATLGVKAGVPELATSEPGSALIVGQQASFTLPIRVPTGATLPGALRLGARWQPLDTPSTQQASSYAVLGSSVANAPDPPPFEPPPIDLVAAEQPGTVVSSAPATVTRHALSTSVELPMEPGRYRLTTTIHGADDVAFDAPTQALVAAVVVRVSRPVSVAYGLASELSVDAGSSFHLPLRLANNGSLPWSDPPISFDPVTGQGTYHPSPIVSIRWLPLDNAMVENALVAIAGPRLRPGEETVVALDLSAPNAAGTYMLLIDLISPLHGSLAAAGGSFAETRVTVQAVGHGVPVEPVH